MPPKTPKPRSQALKDAYALVAAHARASRAPLTRDEAAEMSRRAHLNAMLARLRPVHWPKNDPLSGPDVCFILNITPQSFAEAAQAGRIPTTKIGRRYYVTQSDLKAYIRQQLDEATKLGLR